MKNETANESNLKKFVRVGVLGIVAALVAAGCTTKKKDVVSEVEHSAYIKKSALVGTASQPKIFHLQRGVEDADGKNYLGAIPSMSDDFGLVKARITEKYLILESYYNPGRRVETAVTVASYPITKHFDIKRAENDFKEQTNKIVEDTQKPWNEREYIRVDWANPTNDMAKFINTVVGTQAASSFASEEEPELIETPEVAADGHISFLVETSLKATGFDDESYKVKYRTHLMPVKDSNFQPVEYTLKDFSRFGYFYTQLNQEDWEKGLLDSNIKRHANVLNVCEATANLPCSTNKITWVLSKDFPEFYLPETRQAVKEWNETFKEALGRSDDVVVLDEATRPNLTDPRYNIIAYYPHQTSAGLLGVGQWVSDPRTGELVSVRATVYEDGIKSTLGSVDTLIDLFTSPNAMEMIGAGDFGTEGSWASPYMGVDNLKNTAAKTKLIVGDKKKKSQTSGLSVEQNVRSIHAAMKSGSLEKLVRKAQIAEKVPSLLVVPEISKLAAAMSPKEKQNFVMPTQVANTSVAIPKLGGAERFLFSEQTRREEQKRLLNDARRNIHGAELVEEAAIRYLLKMLEDGTPASAMKDMKVKIKEKVAKETFYTTLLHEMGHTFGLRHNFAGSADKPHYHSEYERLEKEMEKNPKFVSPEDLKPYAFSSIMDYGGDFYSQVGGLGPYDKAAIKYAYNRSVDRNGKEFNSKSWVDAKGQTHYQNKYRFCTDHEVGTSILCRRFDKGANASEITLNVVREYHRTWPLRHFRRDRTNFGDINALMGSMLDRTMIPVRQTMDEFIYTLIASIYDDRLRVTPEERIEAKSGFCDYKFVADSIRAGEMSRICTGSEMEKAGVNPDDLETLYNALFDPQTGGLYKSPETYIPYGAADLLFANLIARDFFQSVIGAPEPGVYVAVEIDKATKTSILRRLPEGTMSDEEKLRALAPEFDPANPEKFVENHLKRITDLTIAAGGRPFGSETTSEAGMTKIQSIGSFFDKYAAIIALSTSDVGVGKYAGLSAVADESINMLGNVYSFPQTRKYAVGLFNALITGNERMSMMPVMTRSGEVVPAVVDAKLNQSLQSVATLSAFADFASNDDTSMVDKLRICDANEASCTPLIPGLETVSYTAASGTNKFTAVQTRENDSIAFDLLTKLTKLDAERTQMMSLIPATAEIHKTIIAKLVGTGELHARLEKNLVDGGMEDLRKRLTALEDKDSESTWERLIVWMVEYETTPPFTVMENGSEITDEVDNALVEVTKRLAMLEEVDGVCGPEISQSNLPEVVDLEEILTNAEKTPVVENSPVDPCPVNRALMRSINDLKETKAVVGEIVGTSTYLKLAPIILKNKESEISSGEAHVRTIRAFLDAVGGK